MSSLERHEDLILYDIAKLLAARYDVRISRITDVGLVDNGHRWEVLCVECGVRRVNMLLEPVELDRIPAPWLSNDSISLLPTHEFADNVLYRRYIILSGQCQDCGAVYFAKFEGRGLW